MKKSIFLLACAFAILFASCASDSSSSTGTTSTPNVETTNVSNEVAKVMDQTNESVKNVTDKLVPSDDKVDETVDKVASKVKDIFKKGKEDIADGIKKTSDAVTDKTTKTVENISRKSKEIGQQIETSIDNTATEVGEKINTTTKNVEAKIDNAVNSTTKPTMTKAVTGIPSRISRTTSSDASKPTKEIKKTQTGDIAKKETWKDKLNHDDFNALLKKHVSSKGIVNYKGFIADNHKLEDYLGQLKNNPVSSDMSRKEKLAYWINAYNAFTIKLIVDNYPVSSIKDLHGGKPWDKKWIKIGDKTYSLNNIENDIIRPEFNEPRIHFAVNCAAKSCPPLSNGSWTAANMESKFEKATRAFINNSKYNKVSKTKATVSNIFNWYGSDFGDLSAFLNKYANEPMNNGVKINFMDYDWSLNE